MTIKKYAVLVVLFFYSIQLWAKDYPASLFGIYSDGTTLNTRSIQFAIDYINGQGGGKLVFDVGRFLTGSIHLKIERYPTIAGRRGIGWRFESF